MAEVLKDQENLDNQLAKKNVMVFTREVSARIHDIYLTNEFRDSRDTLELAHLVRTCGPSDILNFHLNSRGGDVDAGTQLLNALHTTSAAQVTMFVDAPCSSMAAFFIVAAVKGAGAGIGLGKDVYLMFHQESYEGIEGKGSDIQEEMAATKELYAKADTNNLFPFLSTKELAELREGREMYILRPDLDRRFKNLNNYLEGKAYKDGDKIINPKKPKEELKTE